MQGLWDDGDDLYAIEDRKPFGRLLRYRWSDQSLTVLRDRVQEGESIVRCTDGRMSIPRRKKAWCANSLRTAATRRCSAT